MYIATVRSGTCVVFLLVVFSFLYGIQPRSFAYHAATQEFAIETGEGFRDIAARLEEGAIITDRYAFSVLALATGYARRLQPGHYVLSNSMSGWRILRTLANPDTQEVEVLIPEGASTYRIDAILATARVITLGALVQFAQSSTVPLEGTLFPDRYRFFLSSSLEHVVRKMNGNFAQRTADVLPRDARAARRAVIIASLLEGEVPDHDERQFVAGILEKRLTAGMPLQVDATLCYARQVASGAYRSCLPLTALDREIDSPYNTYRYRGLPPGPIGNPGLSAIRAALDPRPSPYWFYLSDPKTSKTVFARTLDEHTRNRVKYLE